MGGRGGGVGMQFSLRSQSNQIPPHPCRHVKAVGTRRADPGCSDSVRKKSEKYSVSGFSRSLVVHYQRTPHCAQILHVRNRNRTCTESEPYMYGTKPYMYGQNCTFATENQVLLVHVRFRFRTCTGPVPYLYGSGSVHVKSGRSVASSGNEPAFFDSGRSSRPGGPSPDQSTPPARPAELLCRTSRTSCTFRRWRTPSGRGRLRGVGS